VSTKSSQVLCWLIRPRAAELFAFQHNRVTDQTKPTVPEVILTWPSLPSDPLFASIQPSAREGTQDARPGEELDIADATNLDSLLIVCDASGSIHAFLDGSYSLGAVTLSGQVASSLYKPAGSHQLFVNTVETGINKSAIIHPMFLHYPELERPVARQLAQLSSSARELVWYMKQLLRDLRSIWFGRDNKPGARDMGPKWLMALDDKIRRHGDRRQLPETDLHVLNDCVHRWPSCSHAANDRAVAHRQAVRSVGGHAGERGEHQRACELVGCAREHASSRYVQSLTKWETTVRDAIVKIRDDCERRLSPACQRLYLILEDLYGFSLT
jgi:anaphase-promoting complex subunit 4